jgi:hypothetical protein
MTEPLTNEEFMKSQFFVHQFARMSDLKRYVVLRVVFEGESKLFTEEVVADRQRPKQWYVQMAFKQARKEIRKWIKEQQNGNSIVGQQFGFSLEQINEEDNIEQE